MGGKLNGSGATPTTAETVDLAADVGADVAGLDFIAIDVETANSDPGTICQVGLAAFRNGRLVSRFKRLVNPDCAFHPGNVAVHGIRQVEVLGATPLARLVAALGPVLARNTMASHSGFDHLALSRASARYGFRMPDCRWIDTLLVARRTWPDLRETGGYRLKRLATHLGHDFRHHDALADAIACGHVLAVASNESGYGVAQWATVRPPAAGRQPPGSAPAGPRGFPAQVRPRIGDPLGRLRGETVVFTGHLSMPRDQAADIAAAAGCNVAASVTGRTTIVVLGRQDKALLAGHAKSGKQRAAEALQASGRSLRIISEAEFLALVKGL